MSHTPQPPYLVVREGQAFWVEHRPAGETSATLQAFEEGCFQDAWCYDEVGIRWPILAATQQKRGSFTDRLFPWRRVPVQLEFGPPRALSVAEVVSCLAMVLQSDNEFCEYLAASPTEILGRFENAQSPNDIIKIAMAA